MVPRESFQLESIKMFWSIDNVKMQFTFFVKSVQEVSSIKLGFLSLGAQLAKKSLGAQLAG